MCPIKWDLFCYSPRFDVTTNDDIEFNRAPLSKLLPILLHDNDKFMTILASIELSPLY